MKLVMKTHPLHLSENVPLDVVIEVLFVADLNRQLLKQDHVILFHVSEKRNIPIHFKYQNRVLKIKPLEKLDPLTHYQVKLVGGEKGIQDIVGRTLDESYMFEFYTRDSEKVKAPIMTSPTNYSEVSSDVVFEWTESANAEKYELQVSKSKTFQTIVWPNTKTYIYDTKVDIDYSFAAGSYYARVRAISKDGEASAFSEVVQFHVPQAKTPSDDQEQTEEDFIFEDRTTIVPKYEISGLQNMLLSHQKSLKVVKSTPKSDSLNLAVDRLSSIILEFNDDIDPTTVTTDSCYLIGEKN